MLENFDVQNLCPVSVKSQIFEDNNGAICTATLPKMTPRTKHIGIKYHFVKDYFAQQKHSDRPFVLAKIDTREQKAGILTKGLNEETFLRLQKLLCNY